MKPQKSPAPAVAPRQARLMDAIEAHLAAHPYAADSAEGVARWWLGMRGIHAEASEVEQALAALVAAGRLRQALLPDGQVLYSRPNPPGSH